MDFSQADDGPSGALEEDEYDALNDETFGAETGKPRPRKSVICQRILSF
jgi:hypothetical protein